MSDDNEQQQKRVSTIGFSSLAPTLRALARERDSANVTAFAAAVALYSKELGSDKLAIVPCYVDVARAADGSVLQYCLLQLRLLRSQSLLFAVPVFSSADQTTRLSLLGVQ